MIRCSAYLPLRSLASFLALTVVGCSAANRIPVSVASESAPTSPEAAYGEMAALERVIARDRARLGLPARPAKPGENLAAAAVNSPRDKRNAPKSSTAETAQKEDDQPRSAGRAATDDGDGIGDGCRLARAICTAARRICAIAEYLDEAPAYARCRRAKQDCQQAKTAAKCQMVEE
ncbi:MAG: hypothetical protein H6707_05370 [Deltaproteobacteria bacterium]|nr:hypothetical protein [Deltaproteobacteria bacterium]